METIFQAFQAYKHFNREVWFLTIVTFLTRLITFLLIPFMLIFLSRIGMTTTQIGFITGSGWVIGAFAGPIIGYLSDRDGHRKIYTIMMVIWAVSFCLFWFAEGFWFYLIISLVNGLGRTCIDSIILTRLYGQVKASERTMVFNLNYIAINAGAMIGPFVGTVVSKYFGAEIFLFSAALCILLILIEPLFLAKKKIDVKMNSVSLQETFRILRKDRALRWYVLAGIVMSTIYIQIEFLLPISLKSEHLFHWYPTFMLISAIIAVVFSAPIVALQQKYAVKSVVLCVSCLFFVGFISYIPGLLPLYFMGIVSITLGEVIFYPLWRNTIASLNPSMQGTYLGVTNFHYLGFTLGSTLGGSLFDHIGKTYTLLFFALIAFVLSASFLMGIRLSQREVETSNMAQNL